MYHRPVALHHCCILVFSLTDFLHTDTKAMLDKCKTSEVFLRATPFYLVLSWILSMISSSACNKGLQLPGSAAAASTIMFLCGSSRQILITCWQTKKVGWGKKKRWEISAASWEMKAGGRSPFGLSEGKRGCAIVDSAATHNHNERWKISFTL